MTFKELADFLERGMRMSHVYQPLLIRALVDAGGAATLRQLAQIFLSEDESQLQFYEKRIRQMPLRVLTKHGIVEHEGDFVRLTTNRLSFRERAKIKMLCEEKLQSFLHKKGLALWDYRMLELDPVPDNLRYQVLKEGGGRLERTVFSAAELFHLKQPAPGLRARQNQTSMRSPAADNAVPKREGSSSRCSVSGSPSAPTVSNQFAGQPCHCPCAPTPR